MGSLFSSGLRLWRIPLGYAVVFALPLQVLLVWILFQGYASFANFSSFENSFYAESPPPFDVEQWRYFARDALQKDISRTTTPHVPTGDGLDTVRLQIGGDKMAMLNADLPTSGKAKAHPAILTLDGRRQPVKARYMGDNHWHWMFPQKSWRIKTKRLNPVRNRRAFNLKNGPVLALIDETIVTRLTKRMGNLSPDVEPVKFLLNGTYAGLYLWWDIADESLLRRARRMPGSIYRGDGAPADPDGVSLLFRDTKYWDKVGARNAEQALIRTDIDAYIKAINGPPAAFYAFAKLHIDRDKFGVFIAIDRAFGAQHHDYNHNHKVYFDPYKGRFEPIQWDLGGWGFWRQGPSLDSSEYPSLTRLKQHPEFAHDLQVHLLELLQIMTPDELDRQMDELSVKIRPALRADGQRDARDWEAMRRFRFQIVPSRHFTLAEFDKDIANRKRGYRNFHAGSLKKLADSKLTYKGSPDSLIFAADGQVATDWKQILVKSSSRVDLYRDSNLNGKFDDSDTLVASAMPNGGQVTFSLGERLFPGLTKVPTKNSIPKIYGHFDLTPEPLHYRYFLRSNDTPLPTHAVIGMSFESSLHGTTVTAKPVSELPSTRDVYSWHPWRLDPPATAKAITIGPGVVEYRSTQRFGEETSVTIAPGTTLRLAANVSLHFFGKLIAVGSATQKIVFESLEADQPWGIVSLHGQHTAGSRLKHCEWRNGSITERDLMVRSGMVSILDTRDIILESSFIGANFIGDDSMHWGYVTDSVIRNCVFEGARSDALDMDICERFRIEGCEFRRSGNDSLDLMTSKVVVSNCRFLDAGDKGISVGEGTYLDIHTSTFLRCVTGLEVKDSSVLKIDDKTSIRECITGINLYRKNPRYGKGGTLKATSLNISTSKATAVKHDKRSTVPANLKELLKAKKEGK